MSGCSSKALKRVVDVVGAATAMVVLWPVFALVALAIRLSMGRPVMFRQTRPGYRGKPFTLLKFRTMTAASDSRGIPLSEQERLTPLGKTLRRWSLDELPQFWNVFKGEMSLVGPRPLKMEYLEKYTVEQARRHELRPGLTGWAQLNGRQDLLFSKRLEMDVWYVDHWSFVLDLKLMSLTLLKLHKLSAVGGSPDVDKTDDLGLFALLKEPKKSREPFAIPSVNASLRGDLSRN